MFAGDNPPGLPRFQIKSHKLARRCSSTAGSLFLAGGGQVLSQTKEKNPHHSNSPKQVSVGLEGRSNTSG